jgi:hypothetical protein
MKEYVDFITDSFTDYAGKKHDFVIAAVSQVLPTTTGELGADSPIDDTTVPVTYEVGEYVEDYGTVNYLGEITKVVRLGLSICNPLDEFDEKVGAMKAAARARRADPTLFGSNKGVINKGVVQALLIQEAEYVKNNPENFIQGYADMRDRYLTRKQMESLEDNLSPVEKEVVEKVRENPHFLDNAMKYIEWLRNQDKGNRVKNS